MKIGVFSDLHVNICSNDLGTDIRTHIIYVINREKLDIVLIAGDISDFATMSIRFIEQIEAETEAKVYFIPGNHDIWDDNNSWTSYDLFKNHHSTLIDRPVMLPNDYVLIGDMGWYDYSFGPKTLSDRQFEESIGAVKEGKYTKWGITNPELCEQMINKFEKQLNQFQDKKIIFTNHFIPYDDFITTSSDFDWNVLNSMMGSSNLGKLLDNYANIEYIIFGHTHRRYGMIEFGNPKVICNPLGYAREWLIQYSKEDIEKNINDVIVNEITKTLTIIEV